MEGGSKRWGWNASILLNELNFKMRTTANLSHLVFGTLSEHAVYSIEKGYDGSIKDVAQAKPMHFGLLSFCDCLIAF